MIPLQRSCPYEYLAFLSPANAACLNKGAATKPASSPTAKTT